MKISSPIFVNSKKSTNVKKTNRQIYDKKHVPKTFFMLQKFITIIKKVDPAKVSFLAISRGRQRNMCKLLFFINYTKCSVFISHFSERIGD